MVSSGLYSVQVSEPPASNATENNHSNNSANTEPSYVSLMLGPANFTVIDDAADIAAQRARMEAAGISTATSASSASGDTSRASTHASAPEPDVTSTAGTSRTQEIADQDKLKKHKHNKVQQRYVLRVKLFRTAPFKSPPEEESTGREEGEDDEEEVPTYDGSNGESEGSEIESEGSSDEDEDSAAEEIDRQREDERWELDYPGYGGHGSEYDDDDDDDDEEDDDDDDEGSRIRGRFVEGPGTYEEEEEEEEEEEDTAEKTEEKAEGKAKEKAEKEDKKPKAGAKEKDKKKTTKEDKKPKATVETKDDTKSAKKEPKKDKKPRYSRGAALIDALSKGGAREDLITLIDDLYEKNGGQRNANGAKVMLDIHIPVLKLAGCLEEKNGKLKLVK